MIQGVRIPVEDGVVLEGRFHPGPGKAGDAALILHPHPLYGGDMDNNVVAALKDAAIKAGLDALLINFRGVGASTGSHDGQNNGESRDVLAAAKWLRQKKRAGNHPGRLFIRCTNRQQGGGGCRGPACRNLGRASLFLGPHGTLAPRCGAADGGSRRPGPVLPTKGG